MPIILAHQKCTFEEWSIIHEKMGKKDINEEEKKEINKILVSHGIFNDCKRRIIELIELEIAELDKIPGESRKKEMLRIWAKAENNYMYKSFAGEKTPQNVRIDDLEGHKKFLDEQRKNSTQ